MTAQRYPLGKEISDVCKLSDQGREVYGVRQTENEPPRMFEAKGANAMQINKTPSPGATLQIPGYKDDQRKSNEQAPPTFKAALKLPEIKSKVISNGWFIYKVTVTIYGPWAEEKKDPASTSDIGIEVGEAGLTVKRDHKIMKVNERIEVLFQEKYDTKKLLDALVQGDLKAGADAVSFTAKASMKLKGTVFDVVADKVEVGAEGKLLYFLEGKEPILPLVIILEKQVPLPPNSLFSGLMKLNVKINWLPGPNWIAAAPAMLEFGIFGASIAALASIPIATLKLAESAQEQGRRRVIVYAFAYGYVRELFPLSPFTAQWKVNFEGDPDLEQAFGAGMNQASIDAKAFVGEMKQAIQKSIGSLPQIGEPEEFYRNYLVGQWQHEKGNPEALAIEAKFKDMLDFAKKQGVDVGS